MALSNSPFLARWNPRSRKSPAVFGCWAAAEGSIHPPTSTTAHQTDRHDMGISLVAEPRRSYSTKKVATSAAAPDVPTILVVQELLSGTARPTGPLVGRAVPDAFPLQSATRNCWR